MIWLRKEKGHFSFKYIIAIFNYKSLILHFYDLLNYNYPFVVQVYCSEYSSFEPDVVCSWDVGCATRSNRMYTNEYDCIQFWFLLDYILYLSDGCQIYRKEIPSLALHSLKRIR